MITSMSSSVESVRCNTAYYELILNLQMQRKNMGLNLTFH